MSSISTQCQNRFVFKEIPWIAYKAFKKDIDDDDNNMIIIITIFLILLFDLSKATFKQC